ncbi:transcription factor E2F3-like [Nothobranchius furzeri]|uniref:E2F transcription factor 6 n=2 Tax=Nothobranchius TaxID=28779 RepID=A0A1A8AMZ9_NOTFU|nr:transcription factor E2F3-like [Nothobranchius furzeri]
MVKCVVSGCPNRVENHSGFFSRTQKRFFRFPKDPARVQVWLAALRETDKLNSIEQHLICEDHFLPEDISNTGVSSDAIPIMPPCLDGPLGMMDPWGAEPEEEEDQWAAGGDDIEDEGGGGVPFNAKLSEPELPRPDPPAQVRRSSRICTGSSNGPSKAITPCQLDSAVHRSPGRQAVRGAELEEQKVKVASREDVSLGVLTRSFLDMLLKAPNGLVDLRHAIVRLKTRRRRVYDITNVLQGIELIKKQSVNRFKWIGTCPVSSFLNQNHLQEEMDSLKLVEDTLDSLIRTCSQQLFDLTDDPKNSALAYVTLEDLSQMEVFLEQTVIAVKAPEEASLEVPAPTQTRIQAHLKGGSGPITVKTCDIQTEDRTRGFVTLEESRIKTGLLHSDSQNA